MSKDSWKEGSASVWKEVWQGAEKTYSDNPQTQNQLFEHIKIRKLKTIFPKGKFSMLEVGCGTAFVSHYFAKQGALVTCFDINESALSIAKENFKADGVHGKFIVGDAMKLPFGDNQFDVVTSFGLLEHFKEPQIPISEMVRVLKKDGLFFADIVPNRFSCQTFGNLFNLIASTLMGILRGNLIKGWQKGMRNLRPLYFESLMSWRQYKDIIADVGIKNVRVFGNRPFPRLTLPSLLDKTYAWCLKLLIPFWKWFDEKGGIFALNWGAGLWFWGRKYET